MLTAKRLDRAMEGAVARLVASTFVTLGRDCQASFDALFDCLQVRAILRPGWPALPPVSL